MILWRIPCDTCRHWNGTTCRLVWLLALEPTLQLNVGIDPATGRCESWEEAGT